ncbi:hypothetical protein [Sphingopyxis sp. P1IMeth2]|uniref:hypothetical protein n=1 Tax=Sphingopyxis sp. P1IMeth2 TaxID=1892848 RepID=UPI0016447E1F|nr:hypothetical protein [Sphingopyxis sp. P1IMeth2]
MAQYNVIIGFFDGSGTSTVSGGRFYLPTNMTDYEGQTPAGGALKALCTSIPTVFTEEIGYNKVPMARIGWITSVVQNGRDLKVTYSLPSGITPIAADRLADALGLSNFPRRGIGDMQHSHWTVRDGDLLHILQQAGALETTQSSIFLTPPERIQSDLVSVMMPFGAEFTAVYDAIKGAVEALGYQCNRADNIWEHSTVIQDIYSLIFRSKVVICDFSGKNANVFYEAGIAHTLGRHVVPIVQHPGDVPFDLQHHRYVQYLNNQEGVAKLAADISPRIDTLMKS